MIETTKILAISEMGYESLKMMATADWLDQIEAGITYSVNNGLAVIPVHGILTKRNEPYYGTVSYESLRQALEQAIEDSEVSGIVLDIDSPGGEVSGLFDLVDYICEAKKTKKICAYSNSSAFSAAYAIASACDEVLVDRTGGVGSIGVIATHVDISEVNKKEGIRYTSIYAGAKKNDLTPHEELSESGRTALQKEVERLYGMFVEYVSTNRRMSTEAISATEAGIFYGTDAVKSGLADGVISSFDEIVKRFGVELDKSDIMELEGKMNDKVEDQIDDKYRAEVLEIVQLCKLARAESKIADFIEKSMSVEQVKEALLSSLGSTEVIDNHVISNEAQSENPVITAAKLRAGIN